jgi:hypothetical protein
MDYAGKKVAVLDTISSRKAIYYKLLSKQMTRLMDTLHVKVKAPR